MVIAGSSGWDLEQGVKMILAMVICSFVVCYLVGKAAGLAVLAVKCSVGLFSCCWLSNQVRIFDRGSFPKQVCDNVLDIGSWISSRFFDKFPKPVDTQFVIFAGLIVIFLLLILK